MGLNLENSYRFALFSLAFLGLTYGCSSNYDSAVQVVHANYACIGVENTGIQQLIQDSTLKWVSIPKKGFAKPYDNLHYWLKFRVYFPKSGDYYLVNDYSMLEHVQAYLVDNDSEIISLGDQGLRSVQSEIPFPFPVFELNLQQGYYDIYVYQYKRFSSSAQQISFLSSSEFFTFFNSYQFWSGLVYALFILLFLQGIISFVLFKSKKYLLYSLYLISLFGIFFISEGSYKLLFPTSWHSDIYFLLYYFFVLSLFFLFSLFSLFIPLFNHFPWLRKSIFFLFLVSFFLVGFQHYAFQYLPNYPTWAFQVSNLGLALLPIMMLFLSFYFYIKFKYQQALWILMVFGFTLLFYLVFSLLPFLGVQHAVFIQFKFIIAVEAVAVFIVLYNDFLIVSNEKKRLEISLRNERYLASLAYISGIAQERHLIFSKFHDELSLNITIIQREIERFMSEDQNTALKISMLLSKLKADIRLISQGIFPVELHTNGLVSAIESRIQIIEDHFPDLVVIPEFSGGISDVNSDVELLFYLTFNELIQNALKYSFCTEIRIKLYSDEGHLILEVEDNGIGYDASMESQGLGLSNLYLRALNSQGYFRVVKKEPGILNIFCIPKLPS
jgi:signal transduction histidine kinase